MLNIVVLSGVLARPASTTELPSGTRLAGLELTVRRSGGPAETVPVVWFDPPAWATSLDTGADLVVVGRVRRRFFRAGGATQSRTEVVAARVVRASARLRAASLLAEAAASIEDAASA
jgi:single-strand DNA-binding protein